ncbi:hypothetical protein BDV25DRAFT_157179 [Aspergillus avenaceus]|uniref:Uncharacterized protein n=1 Tax=Aspergillus avenaceus TaxID=36643 RepID=A0A5N6TSE9_ASPAV|nr:hypothetical protein BDV25DRAFT_157179 [Aspergillus avenaceus]
MTPRSIEVAECAGSYSLFLEGFSSWSIAPTGRVPDHTCDLPSIKRAPSRKVYIGESSPNTCDLSEEFLPEWCGLEPHPESAGNYLSVFVLGWSYILSARLLELRQTTPEDRIVYTSNKAESDGHHERDNRDYFHFDIGTDNYAEVQWWAAILAEGCGWRATFVRDSKKYYPPWECHLNSSPFILHHSAQLESSGCTVEPPSSSKALEYLCNLARFYNAFDQLVTALAATITLPSHNRFGSSITLPSPINRPKPRQNTELMYACQIPTTTELANLMTLSCTSGLVASCLFGSFWKPGISCNLASQWLNPPLKQVFLPYIHSKNFISIIYAMSQRRPNLASLWLGSVVTGLLPRIFQVSRSFLPTTSLEAAVWTSSPQSFMDPQYHRLVPVRKIGTLDMIPREDEFRLLFVTDFDSQVYGNPPLSPYPPFGFVDIQHTSLDVRLHLSCCHKLEYHSWNWQCHSGRSLSDSGTPCLRKGTKPNFKTNILPAVLVVFGILSMTVYKPKIRIENWLHKYSILLPSALAVIGLLPHSIRYSAYNAIIFVHSSLKGLLGPTVIWRRSRQPDEEEFLDDELSELATRNLFSWTFFTEGIRIEEKIFWEHEWLEFLIDREERVELSEHSSSNSEGGLNDQKLDFIRMWQGGVAVHLDEIIPTAI